MNLDELEARFSQVHDGEYRYLADVCRDTQGDSGRRD